MKHNNVDVVKQVSDVFKPKGESMPADTSDVIQLVYDITPMTEIIETADCLNATTATILTTATDKDFFLTGFSLGHIRDGTATALYYGITAVINGKTTFLIKVPLRTLLATTTTGQIFYTLPRPVRLDKGSIIAVVNETAVGLVKSIGTIYGYYVN